MKDYRFYLQYVDKRAKRKGEHEGNVLALCDTMGDGFRPFWAGGEYQYECVAAIFFHPNSAVALGASCTPEWLRENCKRISEAQAREIHPALFERLDALREWEQSRQTP